ncbi:MAG: Flp pilus assembly complex ATPase component TadA [Actinobacteria bacterium]|nr:Flp pilus assembly complex ATPase component TadA [Actinomycetota bacterium]MBE3115423.1 Flp pilus assembly complex ATPase component TadA [Actinomycetota bacterium]
MKKTEDKGITGKFLSDILYKKGLISEKDIDRVTKMQRDTDKNLQKIIIELNILKKDDMMAALADEIRVKYVNLNEINIDPSIVVLISEEVARKHQIIAINKNEEKLTVAMANPLDVVVLDELKMQLGYNIDAVLSYGEDINKALDGIFGETDEGHQGIGKIENVLVSVMKEEESKADISAVTESEKVPIIDLVNLLILRAFKEGASDIHVEPFNDENIVVRYRIDGILHDVMYLPRKRHLAVISRIKIMSDLDITERRLPQDGRIQVNAGERDINVRVSTIPTIKGEAAVLRILYPISSALIELDSLGFSHEVLLKFKSLIKKPNGIILITGPTGCGKTTTLYTVLNVLNSTEGKILTIEDPVEYKLNGINQVQVKPKIGLTFAAGLRSFLRQDPDIMLVGEIRDKETAETAVQAALTGHLILSTLHTNDAPSSIIRLIDIGIEPFLIPASVIGVLAQRLIRKICSKCKREISLTPEIEKILYENEMDNNKIILYKGEGCSYCMGTGYKGRTGIFELMVISDAIRDLITHNVTPGKLREVAIKEGMKLLKEDGLNKVREGITTIDEVLKVAPT